MRSGAVVVDEYGDRWNADRAHALYSGTKSFWSIAAGVAAEDGLLTLDERVSETIPEWNEAGKSRARIRDLLALTSGLPFGGLGAGVPTFDAAIAKPLAQMPGATFTYSGIPLQVFGAVLSRKLAPRGVTPLAYLKERIFDPIGLRISSWRKLKDGTETLPTGAFLTAHDWLKFGQLLLQQGTWGGKRVIQRSTIDECWKPGKVNERYGLGFWLYEPRVEEHFVAYASGAGGQGAYVIPSKNAVIVHFGQSNSYNHERFLRRIFEDFKK